MSKDMAFLEITEADIERTAQFLVVRYERRAESLAWSQISELVDRDDRDAVAIWEQILAEIRRLTHLSTQ